MKNRKEPDDLFMKTLRKNVFGRKQKIDNKTILLAASGDTEALMEVVDAYKPYIEKLSMRGVIDADGQYHEAVDETVKRTIETGLIAAIMKFNPYR